MTARTTVWCPTGKGQSLVGRQLLNLLVSNVTAALLQAFCVVTRLSFTKSQATHKNLSVDVAFW